MELGLFDMLTKWGEFAIPQFGWIYTIPVLAVKNIPQFLLDTIPDNYFLREIYVSILTFLDTLIDTAIGLPLVGGYIGSVLSVTPLQVVLPVTIIALILLAFLAKVIKLLRDVI